MTMDEISKLTYTQTETKTITPEMVYGKLLNKLPHLMVQVLAFRVPKGDDLYLDVQNLNPQSHLYVFNWIATFNPDSPGLTGPRLIVKPARTDKERMDYIIKRGTSYIAPPSESKLALQKITREGIDAILDYLENKGLDKTDKV